MLRDILKGEDPAVHQAIAVIDHTDPDIFLLTGFDWDHGLAAAGAFTEALAKAGVRYPFIFAPKPNSGSPTGIDMDGDGRLGTARDAQGYGRFAGDGGMLLLSKWPIGEAELTDFTSLKWTDLPGAILPETNGKPFPSIAALKAQRLSSVGHWDVPIEVGDVDLHLLAFAAGPPVFDGPEDRNGKRNHDEIALWSRYLSAELSQSPPDNPVVVLGNANLDPMDGEGLHQAIADLTQHPRLQDPQPKSHGAEIAAQSQGGVNLTHVGDPALDTADWSDETGPGNLRVSYVLPDTQLKVTGAGVFWPTPDDTLSDLVTGEGAARHHLVWVDIDLDG